MSNTDYKTNDFALSASLLAMNFKVQKLEKLGSGRVVFYFENSNNLLEAVDDYWQDKLAINPKTFFNAQKELKARMYAIA
jgi:hypothetical protein